MKKLVGLLLLMPSLVYAQATPASKFQWNMDDDTLALAQGWTYQLELDNLAQSKTLLATCVGARPYVCTAPLPNMTPTQHKARIRAIDLTSGSPKYSGWSNAVTFTMGSGTTPPVKPLPKTPFGLIIIPGSL